MKAVNLSKADIMNELAEGKVIRKTCGIWNDPDESGRICETPEDIINFYKWAYLVEVYESDASGIDYELIGAGVEICFNQEEE